MDNGKVLHFLAAALAGWVNRHQQAIIDYLIEENRLFKQQFQGRRLSGSRHEADEGLQGRPRARRCRAGAMPATGADL